MNIIEKIQEKTRQEYVDMPKLWLARLSGLVQQKPLQFFFGALALGFFLAVLSKIFFSLLVLALCAAGAVYFIAPEKKI